MARALLICHRYAPVGDCDLEKIQVLNDRLTPDNIVPRAPRIMHADERVVAAVFNSSRATDMAGPSICIGAGMTGAAWQRPGGPVPGGSFAVLRVDAEQIELVADAVASRTLWYAQSDETFVASSSQRAVVALLGSFEPDAETASWMLSSGTLGPERGWDVRLAAVPPGGHLTFDRTSWRSTVTVDPISFEPQRLTRAEHRRRLENAVEAAVQELDCDLSTWLLPLSGGIDSRGLLLAYLRGSMSKERLSCVTWGRQSALDEPGNDAYVARLLARHYGVSHRYFATDISEEDRDSLVSRFLVAGEGRVASISGYLDGFDIWKTFYDDGVQGIIRGDEAFGWLPVRGRDAPRRSTGLITLQDLGGDALCASLGMPPQSIPPTLARRPKESDATWRDRMYQQFRLPVVLSALTDLKSAYVEIVNPLLSTAVLQCVRHLPDALRTDKRLWREIVGAWGPDIATAKDIAIVPLRGFLRDRAVLELMHDELRSAAAVDALGADCSAALVLGMEEHLAAEARGARKGLRSLRSAVASKARRLADKIDGGRPRLDPLTLAFRGFIVSRMNRLLAQDALALRAHRLDRT